MSDISLTSSMRSDLLNLQQTTKLQQLTQNRLASGLKVNSAIDNPSSYYAAQSLNNRAEDLNVLLDAMSQGIQTLKAMNESIESGTKLLEQAKSVASSAMESTQPIAARVTTEAELLAAVNSGKKGLIVLDRDITMSQNQNIVLQDGQSLVGARYVDKNATQTKLNFNFVGEVKDALKAAQGSLISDLDINYTNNVRADGFGTVYLAGNNKVQNLNITVDTSAASEVAAAYAIFSDSQDNQILGTINIKGVNLNFDRGIVGSINLKDATLNIKANYGLASGKLNISNSKVNLRSDFAFVNKEINILDNASTFSISNGTAYVFFNSKINAPVGVQIITGNKSYISQTAVQTGVYMNNVPPAGFVEQAGTVSPVLPDIDAEMAKKLPPVQKHNEKDADKQFNQILAQYNSLIKDSSYKGVNLLQSQDLKVVFNEDRSSALDVKGIDASASGLGLNIADWNSAAAVQASLDEIDDAINQLRQHASEFGNYYQIVTAREDFTNSLITVLTEGADDLTLADMNQESANMLALQTRQQLAVNSLSLASQASQSVLKLF